MSSQTTTPNPTVDPYKCLQIIPNRDGSITRTPSRFPTIPPAPHPHQPVPVLSDDFPVNQSTNTWARVFLSRRALDSSFPDRLPLLVYFHGGGFIHCSAATVSFHEFCSNIAADLNMIIASVDYRLAPEHRLPAAYDDAMDALYWLKTTQAIWLRDHADFSNCFVMGTSSGANIAYYAGLRAAAEVENLKPLRIKGLILHIPFFGGSHRTESELRLVNDPILKPGISDLLWALSLPIGVDRDHEYCNPTVAGGSEALEKIRALGWKVLVSGHDGDPIVDHQIEFVKMMAEKGVEVVCHIEEGGYHGIEISEPTKAKALLAVLKDFMSSVEAVAG